ncbi:MAG TPA: N-acyl homoserine lactonase family protein [Solirubrobacteraceae bacterium]|jgi:glyoxylase-like metal-dependent hydrolase (beta-lactamase superfamily II)|nr:N-acyl homoserine lactonase family protein [Solirubrobacteraceae bacterium]
MGLSIRALKVGRLVGQPKPTITHFRGWGETYDPTLIVFLIEGGESPILVDTGPSTVEAAWDLHHYRLEQSPEERLPDALAAAGVDASEIKLVVNTHLHWDHCSNNALFPDARVIVQKDELLYAVDPLEWNRVAYEKIPGIQPPWFATWSNIETVDGETEIAPGVSTILLPGHTPGSQGVVVEAEGGRYLIAGDCVPTYENWAGDAAATHIPDGLNYNLVVYAESFRKIEALDCEVIPSHDAAVIEHGVWK